MRTGYAAEPIATLRLCVVEARPVVQAVFLLRFQFGFLLRSHAGAAGRLAAGGGRRLLLAAAVWALVVLATYLFDGVMDIVEDRENGSTRPIASGALSRDRALVVAAAWAGLALLGAGLLGGPFPVLAPALLLLGYAYCAPPLRLKRSSAAAGATVIAGGLLTVAAGCAAGGGDLLHDPQLVVGAAALACWMGFVGALAKDFSDLDGDIAAGRRTFLAVRGERAARRLVAVDALAVGAGFLLAARLVAPMLTLPAVTMLAGALVVAVSVRRPLTGRTRNERRRAYRAFMLTQFTVLIMALIVAL